jgi:hypothetical protein
MKRYYKLGQKRRPKELKKIILTILVIICLNHFVNTYLNSGCGENQYFSETVRSYCVGNSRYWDVVSKQLLFINETDDKSIFVKKMIILAIFSIRMIYVFNNRNEMQLT